MTTATAIDCERQDGVDTLPSSDPQRPRILLMGETLALSHVARPAMLAAHLQSRGYEVALACDTRYQHVVPAGGVKTIRLNSLPVSLAMSRVARNEPVYDADTLDSYVQEDLRAIADFTPDIVAGDQRHSLAVSSCLAGVPYINIADAHWSPATAADFELADSPLSAIVGAPHAGMIFELVRPVALAFHTLPLNTLLMKYGLPAAGPDIKRVFTCGDYVVYPNNPALFPLERPLPANHRFIGPLVWSPPVELPEWWDSLPDDRPVVYVSLGSTGPVALLKVLLGVLGEMEVAVIAATAGRTRIANPPANARIAEFLPGAEAARRARLVICNGGSTSGQQALSAGVPYLGIVSNMDQLLFSKAAQRAGACRWLRTSEAREETLRCAISNMLAGEAHHCAAQTLASQAEDWDAPAEFERLVASALSRIGRARHKS
jgi:UDP:flavonoid glycosyltransferase YjiC (YdhE family)